MKGICGKKVQCRERSAGARPNGQYLRLNPEYANFEWALIDVNKSGTAEAVKPSSLDNARGEGFLYPPLKERIDGS